jgi:glycyl-tRNA synthetase
MNPTVWKASGHIDSFADPLLDCKECKTRYRADNLINDFDAAFNADAMTQEEMLKIIKAEKIPCPKCGKSNFTDIRQFNLMFSTQRGVTQDTATTIYLRPENAQGEYVNFQNVLRTMRSKLPFSIGQIGKAFRNEITPGNFTFRTIEFEQMEYQTFCKQGDDDSLYEYYKNYGIEFFEYIGLDKKHLRFHDHEKLAHYAKAACDIEYLFPFGWGEINGTHNRTDFDLRRHQEFSRKSMEYYDAQTDEKYIPYVIESTYGLDRLVLAVLFEGLAEEDLENGDTRQVLKIKPSLAPIKVNVLPLIKKRHAEKAMEVYCDLIKGFMTTYDDAGNIGRRYRRGDAIGIPYSVTIDDVTLERDTVTVRDRDTMQQVTVETGKLKSYLFDNINE